MSDDRDFSELEEFAARSLRAVRELPPGLKRDAFLEEIEQYIVQLSALKAKEK